MSKSYLHKFAGFKEIPPVSKQTPLPTNAKGLDFDFAPFHSIVINMSL